MKFIFTALLWLFLLSIAIPSCGRKVDKLCVKGKSREDQVLLVQGQNPRVVIVQTGDRIVRAQCSEMLRSITFREPYERIFNYFNRPALVKLRRGLV